MECASCVKVLAHKNLYTWSTLEQFKIGRNCIWYDCMRRRTLYTLDSNGWNVHRSKSCCYCCVAMNHKRINNPHWLCCKWDIQYGRYNEKIYTNDKIMYRYTVLYMCGTSGNPPPSTLSLTRSTLIHGLKKINTWIAQDHNTKATDLLTHISTYSPCVSNNNQSFEKVATRRFFRASNTSFRSSDTSMALFQVAT